MIGAGVAIALVIGAAAFDPAEAGGVFEAIANPGASYNGHLQQAVADVTNTFLGHALPTAEGLALLAIALGVAVTVATMPRFRTRGVPILAAVALIFCLRESTSVLAHDVPGLNTAIPTALGTPSPPRGWVDSALDAPGGEAGALESPLFGAAGSTVWLWVEFWNKSITRIYTPSGKDAYSDLPALPFAVDPATGAIRTPVQKPYLVVSANDPRFELESTVVKHGAWGIDLVKPVLPYRAAWTFVNGAPKDDLAGTAPARGEQLQLAIFRPAGALDVRLTLAHPANARTVVRIDDGRRETPVRLRPGEDTASVHIAATTQPGAQRALLTFSADPGAKFAVRDVVVRRLP
jgi:hypothetical protein